jgi:hypothetical protein
VPPHETDSNSQSPSPDKLEVVDADIPATSDSKRDIDSSLASRLAGSYSTNDLAQESDPISQTEDILQKRLPIKEENKKKTIKFKDCVGRKFTFPFNLCQTWAVS